MDNKTVKFASNVSDYIITLSEKMSEKQKEKFFTELYKNPNEVMKIILEMYLEEYRKWCECASETTSKEFNDILAYLYASV